MSDITGDGYGTKHKWKRGDTYQSPFPEERGTLFTCEKCKVSFRHYYHVTPIIYEEMKNRGIKEICE